jgi:hypothetical protein
MGAGTGTGTAFTYSRTFKEYLILAASVCMKTADTVIASTVKRVDLSLRFTNCPHPLALRWDLNLFVSLPSYHPDTDDNAYGG